MSEMKWKKENLNITEIRRRAMESLPPWGRVLRNTGAMVCWTINGGTMDIYFRWWHPLTWLTAIMELSRTPFTETSVFDVANEMPMGLPRCYDDIRDDIIII